VQIPFYALVTIPWNAVGTLVVVLIAFGWFFFFVALFVSGWVFAAFFATIIINTVMFFAGTFTTAALFVLFVLGAIIGSSISIILAPGVIFYFSVLICVGIIFPG